METVFAAVVNDLAAKGEAKNPLAPEDYEGVTEDGRKAVFCAVCGEPKRLWRDMDVIGIHKCLPTLCACGRKREEARLAEKTEETRSTLRTKAGNLSPDCKFLKSVKSPEMDVCWRYVKNWPEMRERNVGLLLWGGAGSGKSHAAQCVANELLSYSPPVSVYVKTFAEILAGKFDKTEVLERVRQMSLVVFDDVGAERGNDYAFETIFAIVDERYQTRKPTIVTTNLTLAEIKNPLDELGRPDRRRRRIYDRILEMCVPVEFKGKSRRSEINAEKMDFVLRTLGL